MLYPLSYEGGSEAREASGRRDRSGRRRTPVSRPADGVRADVHAGERNDLHGRLAAAAARSAAALRRRAPGDDLGRDRPAGHGQRADRRHGPATATTRRRGACTATTTRWSASRTSQPPRRPPYSVELDGEQVWPLAGSPFPPSVIRTPDPEPGRTAWRSAAAVVRRPFDDGPPRRDSAPTPWSRWPRGWRRPGPPSGPTSCCCSATRSTPTTRRRRSSTGCGGPTATRPARRGRRRDPGLRGVHVAVPRGLDDAGGALAAVDGADRDAARRPRPPRRLEHVPVVAREVTSTLVVAPAGHRCLRLVLGVPAPREPQPGAARRRRGVRTDP